MPESHTEPTVFLVDDDDAVRDALATLIGTVGLTVRDYPDSKTFLEGFDPGVIGCLILDVRMPQVSGLQLQEHLTQEGVDLPVIVITGHGDIDVCRRAFKGGAVEFLTKPVDELALLEAIGLGVRTHLARRSRLAATREAREAITGLTGREREVLRLIVDGASNKQAARVLGISARTVETHRASLFEKLGVDSLAQLVRVYLTSVGEGP
ncbi:Tetrathionate reductase complex response regulator [Deinococcus phoenicis]|uniref:Tetrathionate reductase complex response regulator n=1 Tax=Deinococcus phoenicis TaxID=1476583 RepID=A0A016QRC7_9DEIO|nr:response regulator [Deinococcus phoenicis]EYB68598.1 Tetrathionate reductase complex response regulator [Deinococcus phoenicis]